jgi:hypothetical protein
MKTLLRKSILAAILFYSHSAWAQCPTVAVNQSVCSGVGFSFTAANLGYQPGTTFNWSVANNNNVTGESARTNAAATFSDTLTLTSTAPATVVYTVTANDCPNSGTDVNFTINVTVNNPQLTLTSAAGTNSQTICVASAITNITYSIQGGATSATVSGLPTGVTSSVSGGVVTISGTPTAIGTFPFTVTSTGTTCTADVESGTIVVNDPTATLTSAGSTTSQSICLGSAITNITYALSNGATGASVNGLPTGLTTSLVGGVFTITGTPTQFGTFNYTLNTSGTSCAQDSKSGTITVNDPTATLTSAPSTTNQTVCFNTSITNITYALSGGATSATLTGQPTGISVSFAGGIATISGTAASSGTFNYTLTTTGTSCTQDVKTGTIVVNNPSITPPGSSSLNQTVNCGVAISPINFSFGGGATSATASNLPPGVTASVVGQTITLSGTPSASGVFPYTIQTTGTGSGCFVSSNGTITVNGPSIGLTSAIGTNAQSVCPNQAITNIVYTLSSGTATNATVTGMPSGITGSFNNNQFIISGSTSATGSFNYQVSFTLTGSSCPVAPVSGTLTVNSPTATRTSAASTTSQSICIGTAITNITYALSGGATSATVTGLPSGVTATVSAQTVTISGTPTQSFSYTLTTSGTTCTQDVETGSVTVISPLLTLTSGAGSNNQTRNCNQALNAITYVLSQAATGASATVTGLPSGVTASFSNNTLTISGTPTASGSFSYQVTTTGGSCTQFSVSGSITVTGPSLTLTSGTSSANQTVCINNPMTNIVFAIGGGATGATVTGLPNGVTGSATSSTVTISGTPTVAGSFTYTVSTTGSSCPANQVQGTILINNPTVLLTSPSATSNQTLCTGSAITNITYGISGGATSANVTGLPTGVTASVSGGIVTISGTPTFAGVFSYVVTTVGTNCTASIASGTINAVGIPGPPIATAQITTCSSESNPILLANPPSGCNGCTVNWFDSPTSSTVLSTNTQFSPATPGVYFAETVVSNGNCRSASRTQVTWSRIASPVISLVVKDDICEGQVVSATSIGLQNTTAYTGLTVSYGGSWTVTNNIGLNPNTQPITTNPATIPSFTSNLASDSPVNATYSVTYIVNIANPAKSCTTTTQVTDFDINPLPNITFTPASISVCNNATSTPGVAIETVNIPGNVEYRYTINSTASGLPAPSSNFAPINSTPINIIQPNWDPINNGAGLIRDTIRIITRSYGSCLAPAVTIPVVILPTPIPALTSAWSPNIVCSGEIDANTLVNQTTTTGNTSYTWAINWSQNPDNNLATGTVSSISGTWRNTSENQIQGSISATAIKQGCSGTASVGQIIVLPEPRIDFIQFTADTVLQTLSDEDEFTYDVFNVEICNQNNLSLNAISDVTDDSYNWEIIEVSPAGSEYGEVAGGATEGPLPFNLLTATTITDPVFLTVRIRPNLLDGANNCAGRDSADVRIQINPGPKVEALANFPGGSELLDPEIVREICEGTDVIPFIQLSASNFPNQNDVTWEWEMDIASGLSTIPAPANSTNDEIGPYDVSNSASQSREIRFNVSATAQGCTSRLEYTFEVNPNPNILPIDSPFDVCDGQPAGDLVDSLLRTDLPLGTVQYNWDNTNFNVGNGVPNDINGIEPGELNFTPVFTDVQPSSTINLIAISDKGCVSDISNFTILINNNPDRPQIIHQFGDSAFCQGTNNQYFSSQVSDLQPYAYSWSTIPANLIQGGVTSNANVIVNFENSQNGTVVLGLTITNTNNGCRSDSSKIITVTNGFTDDLCKTIYLLPDSSAFTVTGNDFNGIVWGYDDLQLFTSQVVNDPEASNYTPLFVWSEIKSRLKVNIEGSSQKRYAFWAQIFRDECFNKSYYGFADCNSPIISGNDQVEPADYSSLLIFPNPANTQLTISLDEVSTGDSRIEIFDLTGRCVWVNSILSGTEFIHLPVSNWNSGLYSIRLIYNEGKIRTAKFVKD